MTGRTQERLRDLATALCQSVQQGDIPELRLPEQTRQARQPARSRLPRRAAQRRAGARAWLVPAGAAASVLAVIGVVSVVGRDTMHHPPGGCVASARSTRSARAAGLARPATGTGGRSPRRAASGPPRYLVTAVGVRSTATGRVLAAIRRPAGVAAFEGVAAVPGDRTFYLAGAVIDPPALVKIEFFRLVLGPNGQPGVLRRLPGPPYVVPLPGTSNGLTTIPLAVSPDGKELAYGSGSQYPDTPGSTMPTGTQGIVVQNVSTGARHSWSAWPTSHAEISNVSWASGGQLGFVATVGDAAVSKGAVIRRPGNQLNVLMVLNTAACGSSLISDSHLVAYGATAVPAGLGEQLTAGPSGGAISQDGRTAYARIDTPNGPSRLVAISVATGEVTRVLLSGPQAADPAVAGEGPSGMTPAPMSIDGASMLFPLSLPHAPRPHPGPPFIVGHLAMINLATGRITPLPIPLYESSVVPIPLMGAAW